MMNGKTSLRHKIEKEVSFMTLADLITALLSELSNTYVTTDNSHDKKMRRKIKQTSELINSYKQISNVVLKGNPFHKHNHGGGDSGNRKSRKFPPKPDLSTFGSASDNISMLPAVSAIIQSDTIIE